MNKLQNKKILLIGGMGFIGQNLLKQLILEECKIVILINPLHDLSSINAISPDIDIIYGTLIDYELIVKTVKSREIDTIIHLSSALLPSSNINEFLNELNFVINPTIKLLPFFASQNCKLFYFSSGGVVYGDNNSEPINENNNTNPINYYGLSKKILEDCILFESRNSNLKYIIIRPSNPYGIGQKINGKQGIIAVAIGCLLNKKNLEIWGDGSVIRDYIYIVDLINLLIQIIKSDECNEIFNIGSGIGYTINEIIDIVNTQTNEKINVKYKMTRKVDSPKIILDISKINRKFKLTPTSIEAGIKCFFNHEQNLLTI